MTKAERAQVLEAARELCLEVAESSATLMRESRKFGVNSPGFCLDMGARDGALECAEAIADAKDRAEREKP